jgi:hypothetical protein
VSVTKSCSTRLLTKEPPVYTRTPEQGGGIGARIRPPFTTKTMSQRLESGVVSPCGRQTIRPLFYADRFLVIIYFHGA